MMMTTGTFPRLLTTPSAILCGLLLTLGLLTGCNTIRGFPNPPRTANVAKPEPDWQLGPQAVKAYNEAASDPAAQKILRNDIIDARAAAIDAAFGDYERTIYQEDVKAGLGADWTLLALTAGTTVVGAASTKTALGAASAAVVGGTASFDKRALFDKTLPALMAQMVAARESIRLEIEKSKALETTEYTWSAAESDLDRFAFAGSLVGAIASVTQDASQKAVKAKQDVQAIKYQKSINSQILEGFWKPNGAVNADNEARLKAWMKEHAVSTDPGMITMFLHTDVFEAARAKAVKDLNLGTSPQP